MQLNQQTVSQTLECVWIPSGKKLSCIWVPREAQFAAPTAPFDHQGDQEKAQDPGPYPRRRVA